MRFDGTRRPFTFSFSRPPTTGSTGEPGRPAREVRFRNPVDTGTRLRLGDDLFLVTRTRNGGRTGTVKPLLRRAGVHL